VFIYSPGKKSKKKKKAATAGELLNPWFCRSGRNARKKIIKKKKGVEREVKRVTHSEKEQQKIKGNGQMNKGKGEKPHNGCETEVSVGGGEVVR